MIPIVEEILRDTIDTQLKRIKSDPDIIDRVFSHSSPQRASNFKKYITTSNIQILIGFPREPSVLPCYCIILGQEDEEPAGLGEFIDDDYDEDTMLEVTKQVRVNLDITSGRYFIQLPNRAISDVSYIEFSETGISYQITNAPLGIVELTDDMCEDGDLVKVTYSYYDKTKELQGTCFNVNYRIECWSDNGDLTTYMYHLLKYMLLTARLYLISKDLRKPRLNGGDLEPVPEYFPSFVYRRALSIFLQIDNTYDETFDIVEGVDPNIHVYDGDFIKLGGEIAYGKADN